MNNTKLPDSLGQSIVMGILILLTSAGIITIMSVF
jgi:hypothetical protein